MEDYGSVDNMDLCEFYEKCILTDGLLEDSPELCKEATKNWIPRVYFRTKYNNITALVRKLDTSIPLYIVGQEDNLYVYTTHKELVPSIGTPCDQYEGMYFFSIPKVQCRWIGHIVLRLSIYSAMCTAYNFIRHPFYTTQYKPETI